MSRLQAPGFSSRLKTPGFVKSVTAASQVPLPDETADEETLQKPPPPQPQTTILRPRGIPLASGLRQPKKTNVLKIPKPSLATTTHGPSPYERSKPQIGHIPYVGKKRVTGTLKAPENKSATVVKNNTTINKENTRNKVNQTLNKVTDNDTSGNVSVSSVKPVKRQLIPPFSKSKPVQAKIGLVRPKSTSGIAPPKSMGPPRVNSPISNKNKSISRSLQTLTPATQTRSRIVKSASSDSLSDSPRKISQSNIAKSKPNGFASKLGKPPTMVRPRASSYKPASKLVNVVSTPCQTGQVQNKHLNKLKISPIVNNTAGAITGPENTSFEHVVTDLPNESIEIISPDDSNCSSYDVISNESAENAVLQVPLEEGSTLNATYNKDFTNPNKTLPVVKDAPNNNINNTTTVVCDPVAHGNNNYLKDANQTRVLSNTVNTTQCLSTAPADVTWNMPDPYNNSANFLNQTRVLSDTVNTTQCLPNAPADVTWNLPDPSNISTNFLNQTHVIPTSSLQPPPDMSLNATRTINRDVEECSALNDSNFLEHQSMPLCDDTPQKADITLDESADNNSSFTDDIRKVIAAISSNLNTQPIPSVIMTTSPIKQPHELLKEHVLHHEILHDSVFIPAAEDNTELQHGVASEVSTIVNNDTLNSSALQELELDPSITPTKPKSMTITEYPLSLPTTPDQDVDDSFFNIANRCYTVSAAELRRSKVTRRNTFQGHDSSRFRAPKEIHMLETLEGNIMMDNTSFLQLSNDTRAVKTMLLKLKRTLLEADCPSPLVKAPIKRSNSCSVRRTGDPTPPLSPRISLSSPMAVVDPFSTSENEDKEKEKEKTVDDVKRNLEEEKVPEKAESMSSLTDKFQEALRRNEELEKELDCCKYTVKLLQTQMETTEQKEQDMLEENIILREENNHLNERFQRLSVRDASRERTLSSSGSYKEDFDLADVESRKGILRRMYSNETNNNNE